MDLNTTPILTTGIFLCCYLGLALGKIPGLRMDRAGIALVGATLLMVLDIVPLDAAVAAIDFATILLLFGMMILVSFLELSGFFERLTHWTLARIRGPRALLAGTIVISGTLSAFLVNDIVCLALTPLLIRIARRLNIHPLPHLLGLATAANIGSTAAITGNPQNMIIGSIAKISYLRFTCRLAPLALLGLAVDFLLILWICRDYLKHPAAPAVAVAPNLQARFDGPHRRLFVKSMVVTVAVVLLFFAGLPIWLVALGAAAFLLVGRIRPEKIYRRINWGLLVMFIGLFIVVAAFKQQVVNAWNLDQWTTLFESPVVVLSLLSAALSNLVSNVPAVLLFEPLLGQFPLASRETAWLALAMSSTLAGNLTVLGSVANLIVVEGARRDGIVITFWDYCRVGIPVTILTLLLGISWLFFVEY